MVIHRGAMSVMHDSAVKAQRLKSSERRRTQKPRPVNCVDVRVRRGRARFCYGESVTEELRCVCVRFLTTTRAGFSKWSVVPATTGRRQRGGVGRRGVVRPGLQPARSPCAPL